MRHQWKFLILEAFRNLRADRFLSVTTVVTLGICGFVLSFALTALALLHAMDAEYSRQAAPLRVFIHPDHERTADLRDFENKLADLGGFDSVVFVSKDAALEEFTRDFGEEMAGYLEVNPLPHSFKVYVTGAPLSGSRLREVRGYLLDFREVEEVSGNFAQLEWLDRWRGPLQAGGLFLLIVVALALALIVHNAVKLSLYARRTLVENMKYCGAGTFFIHTPFALEAVLLGVGGGLLGALALWIQVRAGSLLLPPLSGWVDVTVLAAWLVGGMVAVSLFASVRTVRAFLRGRLV